MIRAICFFAFISIQAQAADGGFCQQKWGATPTGEFCSHLSKEECIDSHGKCAWVDQNLNKSLLSVTETTGRIDVIGGKISYHVFSSEGSKDQVPLIVLNGGPGAPYNYMLPLKALAEKRPVVFYDQLGCGESSEIAANVGDHTSLWTIDRFVDELDRLIGHLGYKRVDLLGHSWGTILAFEYYLKKPGNVDKLIFEGPAFSAKLWDRDAQYWLTQMPEPQQSVLRKCAATNNWDTKECEDADMAYNHEHLNRQNPWPKDLNDSFFNIGQEVYTFMNGSNEFQANGSLQHYEAMDSLHLIKVPTLFLGGKYDEARSISIEDYSAKIPGSKMRIFANSSHMSHLEETDEFLKTVGGFLATE